jgi:hypothetical protein
MAHREIGGGSRAMDVNTEVHVKGETLASISLQPARPTPLRTAFIVIYGASALLLLALPGAVSSWLDEFQPNFVVECAKRLVEPVEQISECIGSAYVYREIHGAFLKLARRRN